MQLDAVLNVVWLLLGAAVLAYALHDSLCDASEGGRRRCWLHVVGAIALAGALFPCVSATDDLAWIAYLESGTARSEHQETRSPDSSNSLISLYQAADTSVVSGAIGVACTFVVLAFILAPVYRLSGYALPHIAGRSPPVASIL